MIFFNQLAFNLDRIEDRFEFFIQLFFSGLKNLASIKTPDLFQALLGG